MILTVIGSALAVISWLCAATVAFIGVGGRPDHYTSDLLRNGGLRPGVIGTFVLLTIPILAFLAQSARLGAPHRDRRVAAMRLAGATPRQVIAIGAGESGVAAVMGAIIGLAVYLLARGVLDHPGRDGQRRLPTDVLPPVAVIVIICVALPVIVTILSGWLLRRVITTPLGIVRRVHRRHAPRPWPGLLIVVGVGTFAVIDPVGRFLTRHGVLPSSGGGDGVLITIFFLAVLSAAIGVALGAGWVAHSAGRILHRGGRRPTTTLAAARLIADPWQGSRTFGVLIVAALFGGGTAGVYGFFVAQQQVTTTSERALNALTNGESGVGPPDTFYTGSTLLVAIAVGIAGIVAAFGQLVSISEAIVSRRRTYAALVATGVPRSVLAGTQVWQTMVVAVPTLTLATVAGMLIPRFLFGTTVSSGTSSISFGDGPSIEAPDFVRHVPVPWAGLGVVLGISVLAVLVTVGIGLLFLRPSTNIEELRTA